MNGLITLIRIKMCRHRRDGRLVKFSESFENADALVSFMFRNEIDPAIGEITRLPKQLRHEIQQKIRRENFKRLRALQGLDT